MEKAILLAVAASLCTGTASVCQRMGAKGSPAKGFDAGPLAASQPGFTIFDPLAASLLGVFLFGEHLRTGTVDLAGEALALAVVIAGAVILSRGCLALGESGRPSCLPQPAETGRTAEEGSSA